MKDSKLIGKRAYITDKESVYYNEWGTIKAFDGEYYYIAIANDSSCLPIFSRSEFHVYRERK